MRKINLPDKAELERLYYKDELSGLAIAQRFGCHFGTIYKRLKKYGIKARSCRESHILYYTQQNPNLRKLTKGTLHDLYITKQMSAKQIAIQIGCGLWSVKSRLLHEGIPIRSSWEYIWRGGRIKIGSGYILIYKPEHPRAIGKYVTEHILVYEHHNGTVPVGYVIHHLNGIKDDNRIENLVALSTMDHAHVLAAKAIRIAKLEEEVDRLKKELAACIKGDM